MKKILILGLNFFPEITGAGRYTSDLAVHLQQAGHQLRVITTPPYYPEWRIHPGYSWWRYTRDVWQGIQILRCPLWVPRQPGRFKRIPHLLSFGLSSLPAILLQSFWRPDLVLCVIPTLFSAPVALLAARLVVAKSWLHIQDFELEAAFQLRMLPKTGWLFNLALVIEGAILRRFDCVSTISEDMLAVAIKKGVARENLFLFPNWVDTRKIHPLNGRNPLREEFGIAEETRVVLYHGNLGFKQGVEVILEAARQLENQPNVLFLLSGEGMLRGVLESEALDHPNVRLKGLLPEEKLNQLVNLAAVHVLPQRADAADLVMPSKLTTMLASGRPVIACAVPGTQLWKVVKKVGMTVPPEDGKALASAILALLHHPDRSARLGESGRRYACAQLERNVLLENFRHALECAVSGDPIHPS